MKNYSQEYLDEERYRFQQEREIYEYELQREAERHEAEYQIFLEGLRIEALKDMTNLLETALLDLYEIKHGEFIPRSNSN